MRSALFFSYLFHPVFSILYAALIFSLFGPMGFASEVAPSFLGRITLVTVALPLLCFLILKRLGKISGLMIPLPYERRMPLLIQMLLLYFLLVKIPRDGIWAAFYFFLIGALLSAYIAWALSFANLKISLHAAAMTGILAFIIGISIFAQQNAVALLSLWIALSGIVVAARLLLRAHTLRELWFGAIAGLLPQMVLWYFWL